MQNGKILIFLFIVKQNKTKQNKTKYKQKKNNLVGLGAYMR